MLPADWGSIITENLRSFFAQRHSELTELGDDASEWIQHLSDFICDGGKRIRPTFVWLGWLAGGGAAYPELFPAMTRVAAALEFVQAGALIHDDIIDASDTRRGKPSIHRLFEQAHRDRLNRAEAMGDSAEFGHASAILLGDIALCWADDFFLTAGLTAPALQRALPYWSAMRSEMLTGQYLDIKGETLPSVDLTNARRVNRFKTAAYTIERPLHIGGACAGMTPLIKDILTDYGTNLGIAYQLRDDILGVMGDSSVTGKPSGGDIIEGKRTELLAHALESLNPSTAAELWNMVGRDLSADELAYVRSLIVDSGALQRCEEEITVLADTSYRAVQRLRQEEDLPAALSDAFEQMIDRVINRNF